MNETESVRQIATSAAGTTLQRLFQEVNCLSIRLRQRSENMLAGERAVLQLLKQSGVQTVPQLARSRLTSRQNIQVVVNHLRARRYVALIPNPAHKRSPLVQLTEVGEAALAGAVAAQREIDDTLLRAGALDELEAAVALLQRIRQTLEQKPGETVPRNAQRRLAKNQPELENDSDRIPSNAEVSPPEEQLPVSLL